MAQYSRHEFPGALLQRLCAEDDDLDDLFQLRRAALSRSMLRLRAVHELLASRPGRADVTAAMTTHVADLAALQRRYPDVVGPLLRGPHFSAWATHCLRRLDDVVPTGRPDGGDGDVPLPVDIAQLGCLVAAAALRSGSDIETSTSVRDGLVIIPAVGTARIRDAPTGTPAALHCRDGRLSVQAGGTTVDVPTDALDVPTGGWAPAHRLNHDVPGGTPWEVVVDGAYPYFSCFALPRAHPDTASTLHELRRQFASAAALLATLFRDKPAALAADITCLVPLAVRGNAGLSATSADAPGAIALTTPSSDVGLAATIVHEHQHFKLNALDAVVTLCESGPARYYSPWRDDSRPASGVLHGAFAFLGIGEFWRRSCGRSSPAPRAPHLESARITRQLAIACATLSRCSELTEAGAQLVDHMAARVSSWRAPGRSAEIERISDDLVADHHIRWRLRSLTPPAAWVQRWAATALGPENDTMPVPRTAGPVISEDGHGSESELSAAARLWASGRRGARTVGRLLLEGEYEAVASMLADRLTVSPDVWAALAVAARHAELGFRCPLLRTHPELVRSVYVEALRRHLSVVLDDLVERLPAEPPPQVAGTSISLSVRM